MKKNAFTIIELLAVLVILAIIASITFPIITTVISSSRENAQKAQEEQIIKAAKEYYLENTSKLPEMKDNDTSCVCISTLINGYIAQDDVKNLQNNNSIGSNCVIVKYAGNQYIYEYSDSCSSCS